MRLLRVKLNPLFVIACALGVLTVGLWSERTINRRWLAMNSARNSYAAALISTRAELTNLLTRASSDRILVQNINWRLNHSVASALEAKLQTGALDQLVAFDQNCNVIAKTNSGKSLNVNCPLKSPPKLKLETFYWSGGKEFPSLWQINKIANPKGSDIYLVGVVHLDADWLNLHQSLQQQVRKLDLHIANEHKVKGAVLLREGIDAQGQAQAILATDNFIDRYLPAFDSDEHLYESPLSWPGLTLAFFAAFAAWLVQRQAKQRRQDKLSDFIHWTKDLDPTAKFVVPGKAPQVESPGAPDLARARKHITQALQAKTEAIRALTAKRDDLQDELKCKVGEIQKLEFRLAELAELDSLAHQLQRTTAAFLQRLEDFHTKTEEFSEALETQVAEPARTVANLLSEWQHGIHERGARKFLRGLSETKTEIGDMSLLDVQLEALLNLATDVSEQAMNNALDSQQLGDTAAFAAQIAGFWHGLALRTNEEQSCHNIAQAMLEAQRLVSLEERLAAVQFRNLVNEGEADCIPRLPRTIWVTALYHIYLAMAELAQGNPHALIATRMRFDNDKVLFVVSITGSGETALPQRAAKQPYHLEVARSILAPFPVSIAALPSLDGPFPVALSWQQSAIDHDQKMPALLPAPDVIGQPVDGTH